MTLQGWPLLSSALLLEAKHGSGLVKGPQLRTGLRGPSCPPEAPGMGLQGCTSTRSDLPPRHGAAPFPATPGDSSGHASPDDVAEFVDPGLSRLQPSGCSTVTCWAACVKGKGTENSGRTYLHPILPAKFRSSLDLDPALTGQWLPLEPVVTGMQGADAQPG